MTVVRHSRQCLTTVVRHSCVHLTTVVRHSHKCLTTVVLFMLQSIAFVSHICCMVQIAETLLLIITLYQMQVHLSKSTEDVIYKLQHLLNRIQISFYYQEVPTVRVTDHMVPTSRSINKLAESHSMSLPNCSLIIFNELQFL